MITPYRRARTEYINDAHDDVVQDAFVRLLQSCDGHTLLERILHTPDEAAMRVFVRAYQNARRDLWKYKHRQKRSDSDTEPLGDRDFEDESALARFSEVDAADELAVALREYDCPELHRFLRAYRLKEDGERIPQVTLNQLVKDRRTSKLSLQLR